MQCFVHLGYPKTGTTTLQNRFLAGNPELVYLGIPFASDRIRELVELDVMMKDEVEFDADAAGSAMMEEIERLGGGSGSKVLLSYENLGFSRDNHRDRLVVARRLRNMFPTMNYLVTVRNQYEFVSSMYKQSVYAGMFIDFPDFLRISWSRYYRSTFPQLKYYEFIRALEGLVGSGNVRVLAYEQLCQEPDEFMEDLCGFIGITPGQLPRVRDNVGLSRFGLRLKRILNRILPYELGRTYFLPRTRELGEALNHSSVRYRYMMATNGLVQSLDRRLGLESHNFSLDPVWRERFLEVYAGSNRRLQAEYGLDLERYGYPL